MESVRSSGALDRATPSRLWGYAAIITAVGIAMRVLWFLQFEYDLPFGVGSVLSGHAWALDPSYRIHIDANAAINSYDLTRAFSPGYGAFLKGIVEISGGSSAAPHTISFNLLVFQSAFAAIATMVAFALSRRVLFGYASLAPVVLMTLSIPLAELAGGIAPSIPTMLLLVLAVWQITLIREHLDDHRGPKMVSLTISAGFTIGIAVLFSPAILLVAPFLLWWAFRGIGSEYATLLLVATLLLPACWLAVAQTQLPEGIPAEQAKAWIQQDSGNVAGSLNEAVDRAYAVITPWNARYARGSYSSTNWNYEWFFPPSVRKDTTYDVASRGFAVLLMIVYVVLILMGLIELFAEGAGSGSRLLAIPVATMPFATFLTPAGDLLRISILPFLMIAFTLGFVWLLENLKPYTGDRRAKSRQTWT